MRRINNHMIAYINGKELCEHHPLTVYIEEGAYVVNDGPGRPVLFATDDSTVLGAFMMGHREQYLKTD